MSDIAHRHAGLAVERLLEREHDQHVAYRARDLANAPPAPRPDRRAHVVDRRDAGILHAPLQAEVEAGGIDADEEVRPRLEQLARKAPADGHDFPVVPEELAIPAHRELLHGEVRLEALALHAGPADAGEQGPGPAALEGGDEVRGEQVAGSLASH